MSIYPGKKNFNLLLTKSEVCFQFLTKNGWNNSARTHNKKESIPIEFSIQSLTKRRISFNILNVCVLYLVVYVIKYVIRNPIYCQYFNKTHVQIEKWNVNLLNMLFTSFVKILVLADELIWGSHFD